MRFCYERYFHKTDNKIKEITELAKTKGFNPPNKIGNAFCLFSSSGLFIFLAHAVANTKWNYRTIRRQAKILLQDII